jgi:hypothetical protein
VSAITRASEERLGLTEGDAVVAIVEATEVLLGKDEFVKARITDRAYAETVALFHRALRS